MRRFSPHDGKVRELKSLICRWWLALTEVVRCGLRPIEVEFSPFVSILEACNHGGLSVRYLGDLASSTEMLVQKRGLLWINIGPCIVHTATDIKLHVPVRPARLLERAKSDAKATNRR